MKAILALAALSVAGTVEAQVATGSATTGAGTSGTFGTAAGAATIAGPAGAGTINVPPSGTVPVPSVTGQTFSRSTIGNPLNPSAPTLNGVPPVGGFPPPPGAVTPLVTNTGIGGFTSDTPAPPDARTFPTAPTTVGNTVGQDFAAPFTNFPPRRALSVNAPPGSSIQTNAFGLPMGPITPPGLVHSVPENTIGAPAGAETGVGGGIGTPPVIRPPVTPTPTPPAPPLHNPGSRIPRVVHP